MKRKPKIVLPAKYILLILDRCLRGSHDYQLYAQYLRQYVAQRGCRLCVCSHAARDQHGRRMDYGRKPTILKI